MKMTKKIVLWGSLILAGGLLIFDNGGSKMLDQICGEGNYLCSDRLLGLFVTLLPSFPLFLLSLITYKMRDEVFRAWWNFARWWVPVIILVTYLQSTQSGGGGLGIGGAVSSGFDALILGFFYAVLVVVSLWWIVRKHRQLKQEGK